MKFKVSFVASDGAEFDTETACIVYENNVLKTFNRDDFPSGVIMYHRLGAILNRRLNSFAEESVALIESASAILVFDKFKAEEFFKAFDVVGTEHPDTTPGLYIMDVKENRWIPVRDEICSMSSTIERYLK